MGDGKASSAPRVTARRNTRFQTRASTRSFNVERPPLILEITSTMMRVGYAEQSQPQHVIPIHHDDDKLNFSQNLTESQWYTRLSPLIQQVYDRTMVNPTTRKVVLVHPPMIPQAWQAALLQSLWNMGVTAVAMWSSLDIVPVAQGWKRGLVVSISKEEAVCLCHANGHGLGFTYQSVPGCGYGTLLKKGDVVTLTTKWTQRMDSLLLEENNPNSLVAALLKCLEACPRDLRVQVISNLVFCGEGAALVPDLGRRVARRLKQVLEGNASPLTQGEDETDEIQLNMTVTPAALETLKPLSKHIGVISCAPYRPDWIAWVASSLWAATWNKYDENETRIPWIKTPQD